MMRTYLTPAALTVLLLTATVAAAGVAPLMNYQGMLYDDQGEPLQGPQTLVFTIHPVEVGDSPPPLWSEMQPGVPVVDGLFSVVLGSLSPIPSTVFASDELWLSVAVGEEDPMTPRMRLTAVPFAMRAAVADSVALSGEGDGDWIASGDDLYAGVSGNIGIGTATPASKLTIDGNNAESGLRVAWGSNYGNLYGEFKHQGSGGLVINSRAGGGWADIRFQTENDTKMFIERAGNVGVGTESPARRLEVYDDTRAYMRLTSGSEGQPATLELKGDSYAFGSALGSIYFMDETDAVLAGVSYSGNPLMNSPMGLIMSSGSTYLKIERDGDVGIGVVNPGEKLDVAGAVRCEVLKITGGADLAEPFDVTGRERIEAGMVLAIDPAAPGRLRLADTAYDPCVAGVVSGAGGVSAGVLMGQRGSEADGAHPVALTGRVYCRVTADNGPVAPGDLLTTSDRPGHAMRATDPDRARGAVLGKAMGALTEGEGLVLVLVSLQ